MFSAMMRWLVSFDDVRCLVSPQPVSTRLIVEHRLAVMGLGDRIDDFNTLVRLRTSVGLEQRIPQEWARSAPCRPSCTRAAATSSLTRVTSKRCSATFRWPRRSCSGSRARRPDGDGYLEFQRRPQPKLDWFAQYMS
jgi:hypothetical protein